MTQFVARGKIFLMAVVELTGARLMERLVVKEKRDLEKLTKLFGWSAAFLLVIFMVNIAVGKYMHIQKIGIVAPINGVAEFWLFGAIIIMFSACALTKEKLKSAS